MNNVCKEFYQACKDNDINVSIARGSGNIVYRMDGDNMKPTMVAKLVKMDVPKGFADWFQSKNDEENEVTWLDEAQTWEMVKPVFSVSKGGNIKMDARPSWDASLSEQYDIGNFEVTFSDLELSVASMYEVMANTKKCRFVISKELFVKKLQGRFNAKKYQQRKDIANLIKYQPQEKDYLYYWMTKMQFADLDIAYDLMRHWLWLVKRNLSGLATRYEIFMVWRSLQHGTGKSWSINYLLRVLENFAFQYEVKSLTEERACALDSHNYLVLNFDELSKAEMADVDSLKKWVTAQELSYRPMGSNSSTSARKYASGIGTSNRPISSIIKDITGNRRFVELIIEAQSRPIFGSEYEENGEAWISIWRNIDETNDMGYYNPEKNPEQKTFVEKCLSAGDVVANMLGDVFDWETEARTRVTRQQLYDLYRSYCRCNGYQCLNADNFKTSLTSNTTSGKNYVKYQHRSGQHNYYMPNINDSWSYLLDPIGKTNLQEAFAVSDKVKDDKLDSIKLVPGISFED